MLFNTSSKSLVALFTIFSTLSLYQVSALESVWLPNDPNEAPPGTDTKQYTIAYELKDLTEKVSRRT
jgi:hypothetical protein